MSPVMKTFQKFMAKFPRKDELYPLRSYDQEILRLKVLGQVLQGLRQT